MDYQLIEDISRRYPGREIVLLVRSKGDSCLTKNKNISSNIQKLPTATLLELALDVLEPDIKLRGLQIIYPEQIMIMLGQITASLYDRVELGPFQECCHNDKFISYLYKTVTRLRLAGVNPPDISSSCEEKRLSERVIGRILNEYELGLEAWAYLDEAAIFSQAAGIVEAGMADEPDRIIVLTGNFKLEPVERRFLNALTMQGGLLWLNEGCGISE